MPPDPDSISLEDVKKMDQGEFRVWTFLEMRDIKKLNKRTNRLLYAVIMALVSLIGLTAV